MKVMFIYPNYKGMNMLPPAVGLLSASLKREGHDISLFDTTYYDSVSIDRELDQADSDESKSVRLMARPYKKHKEMQLRYTNVFDDFRSKVESFKPDLLALSSTEDMFHLGLQLLKTIEDLKILTIAGGVFPTFAPELVLTFPCIDIVCKGEGENSLVELCRRIEDQKPYYDIKNLWVKKENNEIIKNPTGMVNMDENPLIDMSLFEEARFYRPMGGLVYRMFPVETHRGCPYKCAFCNSPSQVQMYKDEEGKSYLRRKSFDNIRKELMFYKNEMKAEYLYFWADTFFSWKQSEFEEFAEIYQEIKLPFWCQTRPETITEKRLQLLKEIGCARISFGLEHGNEKFRKKYLYRNMPNSVITNALNLVSSFEIPYSVNNIIGFPFETRELVFDTIRLNKTFKANDRNAYPFTPFTGTPLRKTCEKLGFVKKTDIVRSMVASGSILDMPQFRSTEVNALCKTFNMYVNFSEDRWPEIEKAEADTPEGGKIFEELKEEFIETFWKEDSSFESSANAEVSPYQ